jgi:hypothetical protein
MLLYNEEIHMLAIIMRDLISATDRKTNCHYYRLIGLHLNHYTACTLIKWINFGGLVCNYISSSNECKELASPA